MPTTEALKETLEVTRGLKASVDRLLQVLVIRSIIWLVVMALVLSGFIYIVVRQQESDRDFCGFIHSVAVLDTSAIMNQNAPSVKIVQEARRLEKTLSC